MSRYILGKPARNHFFYGYDDTIKRILKSSNWIWLCGQRRLGKTSIMRRLEKECSEAGKTPLYFDLSKIGENDITGRRLFSDFAEKHEDLIVDEFEIDVKDLDENPAKGFYKIIKEITHKNNERVIFLWDEAERLIDLENNQNGFLETLRAHIYDIDRFQIIVAGTQRFSELFGLEGRCSSFISMFHWIPVAGLDEEAARELICCTQTGGWDPSLPESILEGAIQWCGGHPFMLQYFLQKIEEKIDQVGNTPPEKFLGECFAELVKNQTIKGIFSDDYIKLTPVQQKVLSTVCRDNESLTLDKIASTNSHNIKEIEDAVEFLSNYGYLYWEDQINLKYEFYRELISDGLSKTDPAKVNRIRRTVFISYSHKNEKYLNELKTHMAPFARKNEIVFWDDQMIESGDIWKTEIENALARARTAVLLISPHFLESEFITDVEIPALLKKSAEGGCRILCLFVEHSVVEKAVYDEGIKLTDFQGLNSPARPLADLNKNNRNKALVDIAYDIFYKTTL